MSSKEEETKKYLGEVHIFQTNLCFKNKMLPLHTLGSWTLTKICSVILTPLQKREGNILNCTR